MLRNGDFRSDNISTVTEKKRDKREEKDLTPKTKKKLGSVLDNSNNHNLLSDLDQLPYIPAGFTSTSKRVEVNTIH
jgi:hypothetical protein